MKVALLNTQYWPDEVGGAEHSVRFLAEAVAARGHAAHVICTGGEDETITHSGVTVHRIARRHANPAPTSPDAPALRKLAWHVWDSYNVPAMRLVQRLLEQIRPDVLHTNNVSGLSVSAWSAARRAAVPVVHTLRDYYLLCPKTSMFRGGTQCESRCVDCRALSVPKVIASGRIGTVIGNSHFVLQRHLDAGLFARARCAVVYNAYEPAKIAPLASPRPGAPVFGYIGRLTPTKGVDRLIAAFADIHADYPDARLLVAGDDTQTFAKTLRTRAAGLPVQFLGRVDPVDFYSRIHWCVVPSLWHEPLARVLFESFTHGVPVISSDTGGSSEVVVNGENGYIYDVRDSGALARSMLAAARLEPDTYLAMQQAGFAAGKAFSPSNVVTQYLATYRKAVA